MRFLIYILLFFVNLNAQDYQKVDSIASSIKANSIDELTNQIKHQFQTPNEQVRAVYFWIAHEVEYDLNLYKENINNNIAFRYKTEKERIQKEKIYHESLVKNTFFKRKAVCEGYAFLFEDIIKKLGIEVVTIRGFLKNDTNQFEQLPNVENHAWNAVKINNQWKLIDVTLAAGYIVNETTFKKNYFPQYFFLEPELFYLNHFPKDIKWLFVGKNANDFKDLPLVLPKYLERKYSINQLEKGIYSIKNDKKIVLNIDNVLGFEVFSYQYLGEKNRVIFDKGTILEIPLIKEGIIVLFVNNVPFIAYKVKL